MSRAEPIPRRSGDGLRSAFRNAAVDFYYQSIRLVPANVAWGAALVAIVAVAISTGPVATLLVAPVLGVPFVGVVRLAAQVARGEDAVLSDAWRAYRRFGAVALAIGVVATGGGALLASNLLLGAAMGGIGGWVFATLAAAGLVALWVVSFPVWVILVDPARADQPVRSRLRLAILLVLAAPGRTAILALLLAIILAISTVAFAALLTISVAYASLVAARYLLPLADRLEAWLEQRPA
ncbi:MAG TPA: hypothetical protein VFO73_00070 [Candidatus Limnocylindrales bacterium]|nr:hypothetical protein [Candidatus Limnocylindrales bacterium]